MSPHQPARGITGPPPGIGVVGCGRIARMFHLPVLRDAPGVRLVAVADPDPAARAAVARIAPGTPTVDGVDRLLEHPEVDAVVVCVPTHLHEPAAVAAFEAGRHVYVEKPLAADLAAAERIEAAWRASGRVGMVGFNFRFHPLAARARGVLDAGGLGRLVAVRSLFASAPRELPDWKRDPATGGGALLDLATHHLDLLPHLLRTEVTTVAASVSSVRTTDDTVQLQLGLTAGPDLQLLATTSAPPADRIELLGDTASLELDRMARRRPVRRDAAGPAGISGRLRAATDAVREGAEVARDGLRPPVEPSFATSLRAFVAALADGVAPPAAATIADGVRVARIVAAAGESARRGEQVGVDGAHGAA